MSQPSTRPTLYKGYRFPPEIISRCVWLYYRFGVSLRDVSELMLARGIEVSPSHPPLDAAVRHGVRQTIEAQARDMLQHLAPR